MIIQGVDPGKHKCAVAIATNGRIECVERQPAEWFNAYNWHRCTELHVEVPRVYPGIRKNNPNDLVEVALSLGRVIQAIGHDKLVRYYPQEWKGNIKKAVMTARIKKILETSGEIDVLKEAGFENQPDVLDACGIVLHALGRLKY